MRTLGLDIGTSGCKAVIFDLSGAPLARASREYPIDFPQPGWAQQDAGRVLDCAVEAMAEAVAAAGRPQPVAIGLSCQGEAIIPLDAGGRPLRPAILGMDTRTTAENQHLAERFGAGSLYRATGMPVHTINTLPKLLWIKRHQPEIWHVAARFVLYEDFLALQLAGRPAISRCLASRTQMYDLKAGDWSNAILAELDSSIGSRLSPIHDSGHPIGPMLPEIARRIGFDRPPLLATGGHDQACGALGVGLIQAGRAMVSTGTAEVVELALDHAATTDAMAAANLSVYCHVVPDLYLAMTLNHSGGLLLRWLRDQLYSDAVARAHACGRDAYDLIFESAGPEPSPVLVLPHFAGAGTPTFDTTSRGAIVGLTFSTTRQDIAKACLDGLTFELRANTDILREACGPIEELRAIGGGSRSGLWLQLKADITGIPVVPSQVSDAAAWGAALLAAQAAGAIADATKTAANACQLGQRRQPDHDRQKAYEARYRIYQKLHPALATVHRAME